MMTSCTCNCEGNERIKVEAAQILAVLSSRELSVNDANQALCMAQEMLFNCRFSPPHTNKIVAVPVNE